MVRSALVSLLFLALSLTGCGGGSGGGTSTVVVSGLASKGPFVSGTVNVYDVSGGIEAKQLIDNGAINSDGRYGITIAARSTPVMIEVTAGSFYIDEAKVALTRNDKRTELLTPLRAILPAVSASTSISVTPFTELAVRKAEMAGSLSASVVNDANALIAQLYGLPNILTTTPVDASAEITSNDTSAINYGLALAAVSQLAQGSDVSAALEALEINSNLLTIQNHDSFKTALSAFLTSPNNVNKAQYPNLAATSFSGLTTGTPATAVIEVGLKEEYSNVYSLNFRIASSPADGFTGSPSVVVINEAAGVAGNNIPPLIGIFEGTATFFLAKDVISSPGYNIVANKPVIRITYTLSGSVVPGFSLNIDPQNSSALVPLELSNPDNPRLSIIQQITAADYYVNISYKDAQGNTL